MQLHNLEFCSNSNLNIVCNLLATSALFLSLTNPENKINVELIKICTVLIIEKQIKKVIRYLPSL